MKFHFANIGPIKKAEMELGNLTIIAGRNNTGKTYLVYTLYGFLKEWKDWIHPFNLRIQSRRISRENSFVQAVDIKQVCKKLREEGQYKCLTDCAALNKDRRKIIDKITSSFSRMKIANIFSSSHKNFAKSSIKVDFGASNSNDFSSKKLEHTGKEISIIYDGKNLIFSAEKLAERPIPISRMEYGVLSGYTQFLLMGLPSPFIISAERFGISLFYKELDFTKNKLVEILQNMGDKQEKRVDPFMFIEKTASRYALPIKDNIDYTRDISRLVEENSEMHHAKLYDDIKKIMEGYYKSDENEIRFVSTRRKDKRFDIPLHLASSSARGLSDLYFYLRYAAMKNELLIIDEPESHLDTKNQIMLARMLAHFVRNNIKVLITTHSDYVLKEINNLIMLGNSFEGKKEFIKKHKYGGNEFLHSKDLCCYVAEEGQLTPCEIDKFGVNMPIFDNTIDNINKVSNELATRLEHEEEK